MCHRTAERWRLRARLRRNSSDIYIVRYWWRPTSTHSFDHNPITGLAWTEDGRSIVFSSDGRSPRRSLWRLLVRQRRRDVHRNKSRNWKQSHPSRHREPRDDCSPTRKRFRTNLWRAASSGSGSPERVISSTREETLADYPDGARIAFASNRSGNWEIWMADADGANSRPLTSYAGAPPHSPAVPEGPTPRVRSHVRRKRRHLHDHS